MDGLKLAHAVHDRWPSIKIILVSGHVQPSDAERPANSRFFGKPLGVEQMITELQAMVGAGALTIVPNATAWPADQALHTTAPNCSVAPIRAGGGASGGERQPSPAARTSRDRRQDPACPGRDRRQGAGGRRQVAEADPRGTSSSHQEHPGDGQRDRLPELPCRAQCRARPEGNGGPADRAGPGPRSA